MISNTLSSSISNLPTTKPTPIYFIYLTSTHSSTMYKSLLVSFTLFLFVVQIIAAPSVNNYSKHDSRDVTSRTFGTTCGRSRILKISRCACYLGSHGVTLSELVKQACREAFGDDYASPSHELCKACKTFKKTAGSSDVNAEMKVVYKAASDCVSSMTPEYSYRSILKAAKTGQGFLRHRATRAFWVPALVVVAFLAYAPEAH